ncbi:MAG: prolyl oligopeptidase family serine peptidase [Thermoanaerobaculia bacterium]
MPRAGTSVLLEAYGGYGQIHQSEFNPFALLWAEQGGTYVYAHVRGGGELGEAWHRAATREGKIASTTDTLRVAEWLVEERLTRRGRIALIGTSSGAQIPGLALALAPELFGVVVFNVGAPDEIRGAQLDPTAARNLAEMGDLATAHGVELLREVSPYHRVPVSANFPAVVVKSARDDYNFGGVSAAMKYVARLQAANRSPRPVVWLDQPGGHSDVFGEDPEIVGQTMAFLLWQTGHPRFGPRP